MSRAPKAMAVAPDRSYAILDGGERVPLTAFYNGEDEIDDPFVARSAVGQMVDGRWLMVDFSQFEIVRSN